MHTSIFSTFLTGATIQHAHNEKKKQQSLGIMEVSNEFL